MSKKTWNNWGGGGGGGGGRIHQQVLLKNGLLLIIYCLETPKFVDTNKLVKLSAFYCIEI